MIPERNHHRPVSGFLRGTFAGIVLCVAAVLWAAPVPAAASAPQEDPKDALPYGVRYTAPFEALRGVNPEVCGWIFQEDTPISSPVLKGKDDAFYQTHLFTKRYDRAGTVYMDAANDGAFGDRITWLYGSSRDGGPTFGSLAGYGEQSYADAHPSLILLTPWGDAQVDVFACVLDSAGQWQPRQFKDETEFGRYVEEIRKASAIQMPLAVEWGDRVLALCTGAPSARGDRPIVFGKLRPLAYDGRERRVDVTKMEMDGLESISKMVHVPGRGEMRYYAQNDPLWERMRYEASDSGKARPFGQGGCAPASVAMALANIGTDQQLERLLSFSRKENGFTFCPCSVNQFFCNGKHLQYKIETVQEMRRYLPVVVASFASGNNPWNQKYRSKRMGTEPSFVEKIAEICGFDFSASYSLADALDTLAAGGIAVVTSSENDSPFTGAGHYLVLAHADEEYLYFLDPLLKEDYSQTDIWGVLTVPEPGVVRAARADSKKLNLFAYYLFRPR